MCFERLLPEFFQGLLKKYFWKFYPVASPDKFILGISRGIARSSFFLILSGIRLMSFLEELLKIFVEKYLKEFLESSMKIFVMVMP